MVWPQASQTHTFSAQRTETPCGNATPPMVYVWLTQLHCLQSVATKKGRISFPPNPPVSAQIPRGKSTQPLRNSVCE